MTTGAVRVSVKAIIIHDGMVLLIQNRDADGEWFMLPGGGQEHGETLIAALNRECLEEIGCSVRVGPLRVIRDYIGRHHEFAASDGHQHQLELMFECTLESEPCAGAKPDAMQIGIKWIALGALSRHRLYPKALAPLLVAGWSDANAVYLGDVN